jgi:hypothetical protein
MDSIKITSAQNIGYFSSYIIYENYLKNKKEEERVKKILEEERKKVQPVFKSTRKTIDLLI